MIAPTIRILLAEDVAADAELEIRELKRAGLRVTPRIVDRPDDFVAALREFTPHVILSDFSMPGFDGMEALALAQEISPDTPFVFVSGTIGEEHAIRALKGGAVDYVLKHNLLRLPVAVTRALDEAKERGERRRAQAELDVARDRLREREAGLNRAQVMAKLGHVITGADGAFESWSETLPSLIGVEPSQMPDSTRKWLEMLHPDDRERLRSASIEAGVKRTRVDVEYRLQRPDGAWMHIRQVIEPMPGQSDAAEPERWFSTLQDVTEAKEAETSIIRLNRVHAVLSGINAVIVRIRDRPELFHEACRIAIDHGKFRMAWIGLVDRAAGLVKPVASAGEVGDFFESAPLAVTETKPGGYGLAGRAVSGMKPMISNDVTNDPQRLMRKELDERGIKSLAIIPLLVGGEAIGVLALYAAEIGAFDEEEMRLLLGLAGDISFALEHIDKAEKLDYLAYYDQLTGLANRTLFYERVEQLLAAAAPEERKIALVILDVERFKTINDSLGRQEGDALLKQIAERMSQNDDGSLRIARISADHFAVVGRVAQSEDEVARRVERRMQRVFGPPFRIGDTELRINAKAGIALFPNDGSDADTLFRNAESALKRAKSQGERYLFYTAQMTERVAEKLALENKLRRALERDEFILHYQPKVNLERRSIVGVEALIRWQSPELGLVPPLQFIPLLEEIGLIQQVGSWALKRASLDHRSWAEQGLKAPRVAVNVSPIQLRQRIFVEVIEHAIMEGIAPTAIDLEITESLIMEDIEGNIQKLDAVRAHGVNIAIDDFGTGYSSLGYLAKLPVQSLKIDRSFINAMHEDANAMTLVSTIVSLAHALRLKVVAEGVETEEQAKILRLLKCDEMQGYLFSKPLPIAALVELLRKSS